jgi:uncharacterized protein DUF4386
MNTTKAGPLNTNRKTAILVGVLYIVGTVMGVLSVVFTGPILDDSNYLVKVFDNQSQLVIAALFVLTMVLSLAMIPFVMFPVLKKVNESLAVGYVVFRGALETVFGTGTVLSWLFLLVVSREYVAAGAHAGSGFEALGALLLKGGDPLSALGGIIFCLGALMLYYMFYRSRLIPLWISVWGFIAIASHLATCVMILFDLQSSFSTVNTIMNLPILLQEMVMAVWLIVKGFNASAVAALPASRATNELLSVS